MRNVKNTTGGKAPLVEVLVGTLALMIAFTSLSICAPVIANGDVSLGEAMDNTALNWTTGGNATWFGQTTTYYYDGDAAQSGAITHSQNTYIQTTVTGPGTLTFYWRVSSEAYHDYLRFYIDSTEQIKISGNVNWQQKNYSSIPPGTHTLKWKYTKDSSVSSSSDCGWLDKVEFVGSGSSGTTGTLKSLWTYQFGEICYRMVFGSSPAIADLGLDSTGNLQIVTGSDEYYPYMYGYNLSSYYYPSGLWRAFDSTGKILWMLDTKNDEARSSPAIADIDGNGDLEIAGGTTSGYQIQVFDHLGNFVWVYNTTGMSYVHSSPALADVSPNHAGLEVVAASYDYRVYCLSSTGTLIWSYKTGGDIVASPAIGDLDLDGKLEIVVGSTDKKVYCFDGSTGAVKWNYTMGGAVYSSAALANLTGDGKLEVVVGSNDGKIYCLDGATGAVKWTYATGNAVYSSPAIGDIDADGASEVVVGSTNGKVYALNNAGGVKWIYTTGGPVYSSPSLAYRGGSGLGVYIGSDDCQLYILNGYNGSLIDCYPVYGKICTSPSVADINGDSKLEILFTDQAADWNGSGDYFWCMQDNSSTCTPFTLDWPMFRHDHYHTGLYNASQISTIPTVDYIKITNTPGGTEILDQTVPVGFTITGSASSYNNTVGYIGTVSVTWSVTNAGGAGASASPLTGISSTFNSGLIGGTATWTANYTGKTDTVVFAITAPTVDYIQIRTASGGGGSVVGNITYVKGATDTYWCAGYNYTTGYTGDYSATWTSSDGSVGTVTSLGVSTTFTAVGEGMCTVTADYNGIIDSTGIITVKVNHPPEIIAYSPETDPTIAEAQSQIFAITAYDSDNDILTIIWHLNGISIGTENSYTFTADYNSAGVYNVTVIVSDGELTASHSWNLTVTNVNRPPAIDYYNPLTDQTINETDSIAFNIIASDLDNDVLTYYWYQNGTLLVEENSEDYAFISNFDSAGTYNITIIVSDGDLTASHSWILTVMNVNRAPVIDSYSPESNPTIKEEESQMFSIIASDPDNEIITIDWYLDGTLVASGTSYTFTADFASTGSYEVKVVVSDGELSASHTWVLTVTNVNRAPVIGSYYPAEDTTIEEGDNQIFTITAYDLDNDALTYLWYLNGALIVGENNPAYTFVSDYNSADMYNVTVIVSDGELTVTRSWSLTVININLLPIANFAYCQGIQVVDGDYVNITLRVAGEKYRTVTLSVYEDGTYVCSVIVERTPGSPNDQSNTTSIIIDSSKLYTILLEYTAEKKGGNPVWVTVEFKENSYTEHFVFNEDGEMEELNLTEILDTMLWLTGFVKFDASSSYDSDGEIVNYTWNFGDGSYGYGEIVYHNYQPGNYTVSLTVGDEYGALNTISKLINIVDVTGYCAAYKGNYYGVSLHCPADLTITDSFGGIIGYNATSGKFENWIPNAAMILGGFAPGDFEIYLIPKSPGDFEPGDFAYAYKIRGTDTGEYKFAVFDPGDFEPGDFNPGDFNPGDFSGRIYQVSSTTSGNSLDEVKITYDGRCIEITSNTEKEFSISFTNDTDIFNYCVKIVPNKTYKLKLSEFSLEEDFERGTKNVEPSVSQTVDSETALKFLGSIVVVITILVAVRYKSWTRRKRELEGIKE